MDGKQKALLTIVGLVVLFCASVVLIRFYNSHHQKGCLYQRRSLSDKYATYKSYCVGCNMPECGLFGGYLKQQWNPATGYSWCVNRKTDELIYGTLTSSKEGSQPEQCRMNSLRRWFYELIN